MSIWQRTDPISVVAPGIIAIEEIVEFFKDG